MGKNQLFNKSRNSCQVSGEHNENEDEMNRLPPYTRTIFLQEGVGEKKYEKFTKKFISESHFLFH